MKKLITTLFLLTSLSGFAHQGHDGVPGHTHGSGVNVTASPTINFNPVINVNPNITSDNRNVNKNTNSIKNELKLDKLHGQQSSPEVKKVLKKLQDVDNKLTDLEKKEVNFEELKKNFGKEASSQALLKKVKADIESRRTQLVKQQVGLVKQIKKIEKTKKGIILFKRERIRKDWAKAIANKNGLVPRLIEIANFVKNNFDKPIVITEFQRTQAEQDRIYGKARGKKSWHQFGAALDLRVRIYTPSEIVQIVQFMKKFEKTNALRLTVLYHDIGLASHIHFQFRPKQK